MTGVWPGWGSVVIGQAAVATNTNAIALGHNSTVTWLNPVNPLDERLKKMEKTVEEMQKTIEKQEELIAQQREMLTTLWYHPGMPGATQALEDFRAHANGNDQGRED